MLQVNLPHHVPEAHAVLKRSIEVFHKHLQAGLTAALVHGSAYKGGFIAGASDIDIQLYVEEASLGPSGQLPLALSLAIHRDLAEIDPLPFRYIQARALSVNLPAGYIGPIPGAYHLLYGRLPLAEATNQDIARMSARALGSLNPVPSYLTEGLLEHGGMRLPRIVRLLCTEVSPALYQFLAVINDDAIHLWGLSKPEAIELLSDYPQLKQTIQHFYQSVKAYYPSESNVEHALAIIQSGSAFLALVKAAWGELQPDLLSAT